MKLVAYTFKDSVPFNFTYSYNSKNTQIKANANDIHGQSATLLTCLKLMSKENNEPWWRGAPRPSSWMNFLRVQVALGWPAYFSGMPVLMRSARTLS